MCLYLVSTLEMIKKNYENSLTDINIGGSHTVKGIEALLSLHRMLIMTALAGLTFKGFRKFQASAFSQMHRKFVNMKKTYKLLFYC